MACLRRLLLLVLDQTSMVRPGGGRGACRWGLRGHGEGAGTRRKWGTAISREAAVVAQGWCADLPSLREVARGKGQGLGVPTRSSSSFCEGMTGGMHRRHAEGGPREQEQRVIGREARPRAGARTAHRMCTWLALTPPLSLLPLTQVAIVLDPRQALTPLETARCKVVRGQATGRRRRMQGGTWSGEGAGEGLGREQAQAQEQVVVRRGVCRVLQRRSEGWVPLEEAGAEAQGAGGSGRGEQGEAGMPGLGDPTVLRGRAGHRVQGGGGGAQGRGAVGMWPPTSRARVRRGRGKGRGGGRARRAPRALREGVGGGEARGGMRGRRVDKARGGMGQLRLRPG